MPDDYRISDLDTIVTVDNNDLFEISAVNQASPSGFTSMKIPVTKLAEKLATGIQYAADLKTSQKTLVGAINSVLNNLADEYNSSSTYALDECCYHDGLLYKCTTAITTPEAWDSTHWTQIKAVDVGAGGGGLSSEVIAPDYDSSQTYDVGDYVMHEDQLYVCNTAITTAEAWTGAHWTLTNVETMVDDKVGDLIDDTQTQNNKTWSSQKISDEIFNILPTGTASGAIANFKTSLALPLEIESEFGADGIDTINLVKRGGNFFNVSTYTAIAPFIDISGLRLGSTYTICAKNTTNIRLYKIAVGACSSAVWNGSTPAGSSFTVTQEMLDTGRLYIINMSYAGASVSEVQDAKISLNYGNDSTYHEYTTPITTLINLGDTYYNGGKVTIDKDGHRTLTADGQTVTLPNGEPISALVGTNNVYADTGDCAVTYKKSIEDAIASLQALILNA